MDVVIPITDLGIGWAYSVSTRISLGLGFNTSVWWDVPVPPGITPADGGDGALRENTIVFFGGLATVGLTF